MTTVGSDDDVELSMSESLDWQCAKPALIVAVNKKARTPCPVVLLLCGFVLAPRSYVDMIRSLARKGNVVVCPSLYKTGIGGLLPGGSPSSEEEARRAKKVVNLILENSVEGFVRSFLPKDVTIDTRGVHLLGHSRGGGAAVLLANDLGNKALSLHLLDPVDGDSRRNEVALALENVRLPRYVVIYGCKHLISKHRNYMDFYRWFQAKGHSPGLIELEHFRHLDFNDDDHQSCFFSARFVVSTDNSSERRVETRETICRFIQYYIRMLETPSAPAGVYPPDLIAEIVDASSLGILSTG